MSIREDLENLLTWNNNDEIINYVSNLRCLGDGRNRVVFEYNDDYVIKITIDDLGVDDNLWENFTYINNPNDIYAECRIEVMFALPMLLMEKVNTDITLTKNYPNWIDLIDCRQVGFNEKGNLVAYDYGRN